MQSSTRFLIAIGFLVTAIIGGLCGSWLAPKSVEAANGTHHFSLLAETMQPIDSTIGFNNNSAYLTTTQDSSLTETQYIGQLDLPDGAIITSVRCWGIDTDATTQFYFRLYRYNLWDEPVWSGVTDFTYSGAVYNGGKTMWTAEIIGENAQVDNDNFSYGLWLSLPKAQSGVLGFLRCVVSTTNPVYLPAVRR